MKINNIIVIISVSVILASCGPILGQLAKVSEGVKSFEVTEGNASALKSVKNLLVVGPFTKGDKGRYICRGEDAMILNDAFNEKGLFKSAVFVERDADKAASQKAALMAKNGDALKSELGLKSAPDTVLFGTILYRDTTVAPSRGIVMDLKLKLEFYNVSSKKTTTVIIHAKELSRDLTPAMVAELKKHIQ